MNSYCENYVCDLFQVVPTGVYIGLISVLCVAVIGLFLFGGLNGKTHTILALILIEYLFVLFSITVLFREPHQPVYNHLFTPFWSFKGIKDGNVAHIVEKTMNVVAFLPIGLLMGSAFKRLKWWQIILIGFGISVLIEALQLLLHRGTADVDDVIVNTVGCIIGYIIYAGMRGLCSFREPHSTVEGMSTK